MTEKLNRHIFSQNEEIIEYLKASRLFSAVPADFRKQIADLSRIADYADGTEILKQGCSNDRICFLMRGVLGIYVDGQHIVNLQRKGDIIGEMSMIAEKACAATVRAEGPVRLFEISHRHLGSYRKMNQGEMDSVMYKLFAMILTEKLEMTNYKAREYEATNRDLIESRDTFYQMVDRSPEAIVELDREGRIVFFNSRAEERSGYNRNDVLGRRFLDTPLVKGVDKALVSDFLQDLEAGKPVYGLESPFTNRHGELFYAELSVWSTQKRNLLTIRNITERKKAEADMRSAHDELERRVAERTKQLTELNRELQAEIVARKQAQDAERVQFRQLMQADKLITLGILVSGVAHEINNPNQFITSNIAPLKKAWEGALPILDEYHKAHGDFRIGGMNYSRLKQKIPGIFSNISEGVKRINNIVVDLKEYVKEYPVERTEEFDVNAVVQSALTLTTNLVNKSTRRFTVELGRHIPVFKGDYQRIEQVIINLLQNACEALTSPEEAITLTTSYDKRGRTIRVVVTDEGRGIAAGDQERITDPFFTTKRDKGGIGLRLSISSRIVMEHGGTLHFEPGPGCGTITTISLPVRTATRRRTNPA